jgi:hypothetical protein
MAKKTVKIIVPMKKPPIKPRMPTAIQTVFMLNHPDSPLIITPTRTEIPTPSQVSMNPSKEQKMRVARRNVTETIPAITQGKNFLPNKARNS